MINLPVEEDELQLKKIMEIQDCFVAGEKYRHRVLECSLGKNYPIPG